MKWEYKTIKLAKKSFWHSEPDHDDITKQLNALGQQGWELVNLYGGGEAKYYGQGLFAVLKRSS